MCKNNSYCDISQLVKNFALENNISEQEMINLIKEWLNEKEKQNS